jgi:hypothetical protein
VFEEPAKEMDANAIAISIIFYWIIAWLLMALMVAVFAKVRRYRSAVGWFLLAILISPLFAFLFVLILREKVHTQAKSQVVENVVAVVLAVAMLLAFWVHGHAQTAGGDPPGWFTEGDGTYTNCLSCLENKIHGDIMEQHYRDLEARHRAEIILNQLTPDEEEATRHFRGCWPYAVGRTAQLACVPKGYAKRGTVLKRVSEAELSQCRLSHTDGECLGFIEPKPGPDKQQRAVDAEMWKAKHCDWSNDPWHMGNGRNCH